ncbi:UDP-N-acetylmuramate dehydrogenase [bacterium]|nr:UDP-N-acetylmuramate dehydrogenase [bacterium]
MNRWEKIFENLSNICRAERNYLLSRITSFGVGGEAKVAIFPRTVAELERAMSVIRDSELPHFVIGRGTNLLVADSGYNGIVIFVDGGFDGVERLSDNIWTFGAGALMSAAVKKAAEQGFGGLEELAGIPGSVGGCAKMNASAYGKSFSDNIVFLNVLTRRGIGKISADEIGADYRRTAIENDVIILSAGVSLEEKPPAEIDGRIMEFNRMRVRSQPIDQKSAGCIFKNPEGMHAGALIDEAGLKGKSVGGAMVSQKHANFIINRGKATASDIVELIRYVKNEVMKKFGVELELEVIPLGFDGEIL